MSISCSGDIESGYSASAFMGDLRCAMHAWDPYFGGSRDLGSSYDWAIVLLTTSPATYVGGSNFV